jgi:ABC-type multidrug transport system ATPase subunit
MVSKQERVILDEPTNGLDPSARRRMLKLVCKIISGANLFRRVPIVIQ